MSFVDEASVHVRAGDGGAGAVSFRREAHVPRGGPDGGDGGKGGDVIFYASPDLSTLSDFRYKRRLKAGSGEAGAGKKRHGRAGADLRIPVPVGTLVKDARGDVIEGAHRGAGLGEDFLRHVERTRVLVHVVDASHANALDDVHIVETELAAYGHGLAHKPRIYALNKIDLPEARANADRLRAELSGTGAPVFAVSALTGDGCRELLEAAAALVAHSPAPAAPPAPLERRITLRGSSRDFEVVRSDDHFLVRSRSLERLARGIDWESPDAVTYFQRLLLRTGVEKELRR